MRDKPVQMDLLAMTKGLDIPYYNNLIPVLLKKGILTRYKLNRHFHYTWVSTTEPNKHMSRAILETLAPTTKRKQLWYFDHTKSGLFK